MSTYTLAQQAFAFSMMVGGQDGQKGTASELQQALSTQIKNYLTNSQVQELIGTWSQTWGPCVWQAPESTAADNAMVVVSNDGEDTNDLPTYVVAIAGTNPVSGYDIKVEDLEVNPLTAWTHTLNRDAHIATGTNTGLSIVLNMVDPQTGTGITDFLGTVNPATARNGRLIFTGHSLGGAVAPVLALALFSAGGPLASSEWPVANVTVQSTAGPTFGDQSLIDLFTATFPAGSEFNTLVWNSLDLVPHAWAPTTFNSDILEKIYNPDLAASSCIQTVIDRLVGLLPDPNSYVQLQNTGPFAGTYQSHWFHDQTCEFLAQVIYQHINAYYEQLAPELIPILKPLNPFSIEGQAKVGYVCNKLESAYCSG